MPKRNRGAYLDWWPDRGQWVIVWYERGRRRTRFTGTPDRKRAEAQLAEQLIGVAPTGPRDPAQRAIADVLAGYAEERAVHLRSAATIGYNIDALLGYWGALKVGDIREGTCRAYQRHRGGISPSTVARELAVLAAAVTHDYKAGRLTLQVPVWRPKAAEAPELWLRRADAGRLLRACRQTPEGKRHLAWFVRLALYTGARHEAILSLRWPQVRLIEGLIDFNPPGRERTSKGRPTIPIPQRLRRGLAYWRRRSVETGFVVNRTGGNGSAWREGKPDKPGRAIASVKKAFAAACERAALWCEARARKVRDEGARKELLASAVRLRQTTPHILRHTCASWMVQRGVPFPVVARYLGHSNSRTTEQVYSHHAPDYLRRAMEALGG